MSTISACILLAVVLASSSISLRATLVGLLAGDRTETVVLDRGFYLRALPILVVMVTLAHMRLGVPGHAEMYLDEPWYIEAARSLLTRGGLDLCEEHWEGLICYNYPKATGWPVLLSFLFLFVKPSIINAAGLSGFLWFLAILMVAVTCIRSGGKWHNGLVSVVMIGFLPVFLHWSVTAETNVPATSFLAIGLFSWVQLLRRWSLPTLVLGSACTAFATSIRPEMAVIFLPMGLSILLSRRTVARHRALTAAALLCGALLAIPAALPMWSLNTAISEGFFFGTSDLIDNLYLSLSDSESGAALTSMLVLSVFGSVSLLRRDEYGTVFLLFSSAALLALVVLSFDRYSIRMILGPFIIISPLAGFASDLFFVERPTMTGTFFKPLISLGISIVFILFCNPGIEKASVPEDHRLLQAELGSAVSRYALPKGALVITEWPTVVRASSELRVMSSERALSRGSEYLAVFSQSTPVFFVCDMFCERGFSGSSRPISCGRVIESFALEAVEEISLRSRTYGLYRVTGLSNVNSEPVQCPGI